MPIYRIELDCASHDEALAKLDSGLVAIHQLSDDQLALENSAQDLLSACTELIDRLDVVRFRGWIGHELVERVRRAIRIASGEVKTHKATDKTECFVCGKALPDSSLHTVIDAECCIDCLPSVCETAMRQRDNLLRVVNDEISHHKLSKDFCGSVAAGFYHIQKQEELEAAVNAAIDPESHDQDTP